MRRLALLAASLWPLAAQAGESRCWYEAGVLVTPAVVAGVPGDYVLDTGAPHTLLAETQAQGAGFAETTFTASVRLAGATFADRPVAAAKLDARFYWLSTPVAGVIGADLLRDQVLDVRFVPCRVAIWPAGRAPGFPHGQTLALGWADGRPVAEAAIADAARAIRGEFVLATGSDTPVRLRDDLADAPGATAREPLYPYGAKRPRLRALSFAGDLFENMPSGLAAKSELPASGEIGAPVLSRYRLRFDFPAGRLTLVKEKGPPATLASRLSAPRCARCGGSSSTAGR